MVLVPKGKNEQSGKNSHENFPFVSGKSIRGKGVETFKLLKVEDYKRPQNNTATVRGISQDPSQNPGAHRLQTQLREALSGSPPTSLMLCSTCTNHAAKTGISVLHEHFRMEATDLSGPISEALPDVAQLFPTDTVSPRGGWAAADGPRAQLCTRRRPGALGLPLP